jgi:hypothetical protein
LNLITRKTYIEMGLNLFDLVPVHDTFHGVIPRQSSTPIRCIDTEVSCGIGDNKHKEMLIFWGGQLWHPDNCNLGRPFLLMFMVVIHTAYATMKMPGPKDMIMTKADQHDALACENATLTQVGQFGEKATKPQVAKMAKTSGGGTPFTSLAPKPQTTGTPWPPSAKKGTHVASGSNQHPSINKQMTTRSGPQTKKSQLARMTRIGSSTSTQAWRPNRNSRSLLFYRKI